MQKYEYLSLIYAHLLKMPQVLRFTANWNGYMRNCRAHLLASAALVRACFEREYAVALSAPSALTFASMTRVASRRPANWFAFCQATNGAIQDCSVLAMVMCAMYADLGSA